VFELYFQARDRGSCHLFGSIHNFAVEVSGDICGFSLDDVFDSALLGELFVVFTVFEDLDELL
jgi:hypothetical protein